MPRVANVAEALRKEVQRRGKAGPTVLVRAIARGFYGYPLADTHDAGEEFRMRVADLDVFDAKKPKYYNGVPVRTITHDGKKLVLPTWCEDASEPSSLKDEEVDDGFGDETNEDVL